MKCLVSEALGTTLGVWIPPRHDPPRAGDVRDSLAGIEKARILGCRPHMSFDEGLRRPVSWTADHGVN